MDRSDDIRPFLRRVANSLVRNQEPHESLDVCAAKVARAEGLNELNILNLIKEANQAYRSIHSVDDFNKATPEGVYEAMHGSPNITKVAYTCPEYQPKPYTLDALDFTKSASVAELEESKNLTDFKHVFRELTRKDSYQAKIKKASAHNEAELSYSDAYNNLSVLKTLGYTEQEVCDSLVSRGFNKSNCKYASDIYKAISKTASSGSDRKLYNTEGLLIGVCESVTKFASSVEELIKANFEYTRAQKAQKITYAQPRIMI